MTGYQSSSAQFSNKIYQSESIYLRNNSYVKNGMTERIGFLGGKIAKEFENMPMSTPAFQRFKRNRILTTVLSTVGLSLMIGALPALNRNNEFAGAMYLTGSGLAIVALPIAIKANNDLQQAIWLRNGEVLR